MTPRERTLALALIVGIGLVAGLALGYMFVWVPLQNHRATVAGLEKEIDDLEHQEAAQKKTAERLAVARVRSLPADETLARREYIVALERMLESSGVPKGNFKVENKPSDNSARAVPELSKGKPVYTKVAFEVTIKKADVGMLKEFLLQYHQLGLLHQITTLDIKKDDDPGAKGPRRNDLTVTMLTEGIIVEGAENRNTLLPVPTAFAAIGGAALYRGAAGPAAQRGTVQVPQVSVLAEPRRNYDLIVRKDPFNGPLPVEKPTEPEKFKLDRIRDVEVKTDEKPDPVKGSVSGEGYVGAKVTAVVSKGELFAEGALKVEKGEKDKSFTIELPKTSATDGTATVSVIAISADNSKTEKTEFKVSLKEARKPPVGPNIASTINLTMVTSRSDGSASALVYDNSNRLKYTIEVKEKDAKIGKITVTKESKLAGNLPWKEEVDYKHATEDGELLISDEESSTKRKFKVVAIDSAGLIVLDLWPDGWAPEKPKWGGGKWGGPPKPPAKPPAGPLAAIGGNMSAVVQQPKYYRWAVGTSLEGLKSLTDEEVKKVRKAVAASGPVSDVALIGSGP